MTKETALIVLGIVVVALPWSGFPQQWKNISLFIIGVLITLLALAVRHHQSWLKRKLEKARQGGVFVEQGPSHHENRQ